MKLTTGYDFQGYYISEYCDVIFDEILVGLGFGRSLISSLDNIVSAVTGSEATEMIDKLNDVKQELRARVIRKAEQLGANALIGIDFESSKLGDLIMVSMTATAVKIDKIIEWLPYTESMQKAEIENRKAIIQEQIEKKESEKRKEIIQQASFDSDLFIENLSKMGSTREMMEYINELVSVHPGIFTQASIKKLEETVQIGRLYGDKAATRSFINYVIEYLQKG